MEFNTLSLKSIESVVSNLRKGTIQRISYYTELGVNKEAKSHGIHIIKLVDESVRFGVKYSNIEAVKQKKASQDKYNKKKSTHTFLEAVVPDILYTHKEKIAYYLQFATIKTSSPKKVRYYIYSTQNPRASRESIPGFVTENVEDIAQYLTPSGFVNEQAEATTSPIKRVNIEHIIRIGKTGYRYI